eukprot:8827428-Alexandrium_andersonii.AAC.1
MASTQVAFGVAAMEHPAGRSSASRAALAVPTVPAAVAASTDNSTAGEGPGAGEARTGTSSAGSPVVVWLCHRPQGSYQIKQIAFSAAE